MKFQTFAIILLVLVGFRRADAQDSATTDLQRQVTELRTLVQQLQSRVSELEKNAPASATDRGGLFTGITDSVKESTLTAKYTVASGFLLLGEWRRDFWNQPYFYTSQLGVLKKDQQTATLGVVWWFGAKQGRGDSFTEAADSF